MGVAGEFGFGVWMMYASVVLFSVILKCPSKLPQTRSARTLRRCRQRASEPSHCLAAGDSLIGACAVLCCACTCPRW